MQGGLEERNEVKNLRPKEEREGCLEDWKTDSIPVL